MKPNTSNNKVKIIKGDLILKKDTVFKTSIKVEGNIQGYYDLKVAGNIDAWNINAGNINASNINARDIDAWNINAMDINAMDINASNIDARDIDAWNINAMDINARNIDAWDIICCDKIKVKLKVLCKFLIKDKVSAERKDWNL